MNLDELARSTQGLDEGAFTRLHAHPALIFLREFAKSDDPSKVDTPSGGSRLNRTNSLKQTDTLSPAEAAAVANTPQKEGPDPGREVVGASIVVFLKKTGRNPFESMITVGRATNNDVCLPLPTVSKVHAYFTKAGAEWKLTDQRATNGTFLDEQRLSPGAGLPLPDGARIGFGPDVKAKFFSPHGLWGFLSLYRTGIVMG